MSLRNPWNSYRQVATQTASPGQLVVMLYEGAIRFLEQALTGFALDDPAESNQAISNNILRAQDILHELDISLNMEQGGDFAQCMRRLYLYMDRRLMQANISKTDEGIRDVIKRLAVLREAWVAVLQGKATQVDAAAPPRNLMAA